MPPGNRLTSGNPSALLRLLLPRPRTDPPLPGLQGRFVTGGGGWFP